MAWDHKREDRVHIIAIKDIDAGTEITIDYEKRFLDYDVEVDCKCGYKLCSGVMGISDINEDTLENRKARHKYLMR